ncbi:MAG: methyltransferase domain-containing protein [Chloroflexi bacterium]|nr:methyltransferase domain-containing protein [Chloroflexota bacterium]
MPPDVEESRSQSAKAMFDEWAADYDSTIKAEFEKHFGTKYEEYVKHLLSVFQVPQSCQVLDVATGTAMVAIALAKKMNKECQITGIDTNSAMLDQARYKLELAGMSDVITLKTCSAEDLPFDDLSFDLVNCSVAIHHMNVSRALAEMSRVLKPGGQLVIADFLAPPKWQTPMGRVGVPVFRFIKRFSADKKERADIGYAAIYTRHKWDKLLAKNRLETSELKQYPKAGVQQWEPIPFILVARKVG